MSLGGVSDLPEEAAANKVQITYEHVTFCVPVVSLLQSATVVFSMFIQVTAAWPLGGRIEAC